MNLSKKNTPEKQSCSVSSSFGDLYQDMNHTSCAQRLGEGALWQAVPLRRAQHSLAMCMFLAHCNFHKTYQTSSSL